VREEWRSRIPAAVHVDGTARIQTVDRRDEPLTASVIDHFARRTGVPVVINTSFNTVGRPIVDDPRDALECFGSSPIDALAIGPFLIRRRSLGSAS
jgi:carbamoyltransferase